MLEGFQEVCLDVEVVVQTMLAEAMSHDWAFTAKAAKDLDLWTSALQPLFDTDAVPEAEMGDPTRPCPVYWASGQ